MGWPWVGRGVQTREFEDEWRGRNPRGKPDGFSKPVRLLWRARIQLVGGIRNGNQQPVGLRPMKSPSGEGLGWELLGFRYRFNPAYGLRARFLQRLGGMSQVNI